MGLSDHDNEVLQQLERIAARYEFTANYLRHAAKVSRDSQQLKGLDEMVAYAFNAQQHTPQYSGGGGLPPGKYKGVIVNSFTDNVERNNVVVGGFLAFELTPIEGPLAGQKQTDRLNLHHTNPKTVEIANKQLSAYCHVTGRYQFNDTAELHNIPFIFEIGMQKEPNPNGYTEVKAIYDINGNEPGKAGAGPQPQSGQAPPPGIPPAGVQPQGGGWGGAPGGGAPGGGQPGAGAPPAGQQGGWGGGQPQIDSNVPPPGQGAPGGGQPAWGGQGQGQPGQGQQQPPGGGQQGGQGGWGGQPQQQPQQGGWGGQGGAPQGGQQPPPGWGPR